MTTLADMTPTERAECVGMWGNHIFWGQVLISITDGVQFRGVNVEVIRFIDGRPVREWASTSEVTPRPDLPRAWAPDGTPPAGEWQTAKTKITLNDNTKYDPERNILTGDAVADPDHEPRSSHDIRRWVGEWEQA